ncbi:phage tail tape measure protein [Lachnospiraceae bacterium JLR.KK008]
MNESLLLLQAKLDEVKSKKNLNADIKKIQNQLDKLKVQVEPDPKSLSHITKQLEAALSQTVDKAGGKANAKVPGMIANLVHGAAAMAANVSKIDAALTELEKGAALTADQLDKVTDQASASGKRLARTGADVLDAAADFKRAGYTISDSMAYAEEALKTAGLSGNLMDAGQAADSLIHIMKGFHNESPEFAANINDAVAHLSNTKAIDFDHLIDGAARLSAAAGQSGMSLEQMLGTLAGGYEILGDMETAAAGQAAIFSRMQAAQADGGEELRNIYDILNDTASIWDTLDQNTKNALAVDAAGAGQEEVFLALMQNWEGVRDAVQSASDSFGSANAENEKYINSIHGRVENFEGSLQRLSKTFLDSNLIKWFVDLGTTAVTAVDNIVKAFGSLKPIGMIAGGLLGAKKLG